MARQRSGHLRRLRASPTAKGAGRCLVMSACRTDLQTKLAAVRSTPATSSTYATENHRARRRCIEGLVHPRHRGERVRDHERAESSCSTSDSRPDAAAFPEHCNGSGRLNGRPSVLGTTELHRAGGGSAPAGDPRPPSDGSRSAR